MAIFTETFNRKIRMSLRRLYTALVTITLFGAVSLQAQNVEWSSHIEPLGEGSYDLTLRAKIEDGYHIYGVGSYEWVTATSFDFSPSGEVELVDNLQLRGEQKEYFDEMLGEQIQTLSGEVEFTQRVKARGVATVDVTVGWMGCSDSQCFPPDETTLSFEIEGGDSGVISAVTPYSNISIWRLVIEAVLWGFAALLTPCIFPMVPMTISFFIKGEGGVGRARASALMYGGFIVALYTLPIAAIILITKWIGGDAVMVDIFNFLATHWLPNLIFFALFLLFAASLLGAFEITLPSWVVNRSDERAGRDSLAGIFFLALTLVLVSFSCTGPIVGAVLINSTSGGAFFAPIITMAAFSIAFATPFVLLAIFPSLMSALPKSGGWLNSVKVTLGFIEIALALKFLSVADQSYHWGILGREIYLAIWIVVFTLLALYLLGKLRFRHDSPLEYIGVGRLAAAIATLSFVVYIIPGMWGAPLKSLSGYLPPLHTQEFFIGGSSKVNQPSGLGVDIKHGERLHSPHGLDGFFDMAQAREYAAKVDKPLLISLTGHGCVNCREMEARVWSNSKVLDILRRDYIVVMLYMDDKSLLREDEWITTPSGRVLKTLGRVNAYNAMEWYGVNAQPYYIIESASGEMLVPPRGYDLSVQGFIDFLESGLR